MSIEELGKNWICDLCGLKIHNISGRPEAWTRIVAERDWGKVNHWSLHACESCWMDPKPEHKKTFMEKLRSFCGANPRSEGMGE